MFAIFAAKDFCSGGSTYGYSSPLGTIREVMAQYGYTTISLPYRALQYYEEVSTGAIVIFFCDEFLMRN